jgi:LysM repeat protein
MTRTAAVVACMLVAVAGACGGDDGGGDDGDSTTTTATATTVASATTTAAPVETTAAPTTPETTAAAAPGTYVVVAGDSLFRIADRHCVTLDELVAANAWPEGVDHVILPEDTIQLPANACAPGSSTTTPASTDAPSTVAGEATSSTSG